MSIRLLDSVASASVTKSSKGIKSGKGATHIVDCSFNSTDDTLVSAVTVKLQGSETDDEGREGLVSDPGLVVGSTAENVATIAFDYRIDGVHYSKGAVAAGTAISGFTVGAASLFGGFIMQINAAGTISAKAPLATMTYASMALANAAVDAVVPNAGNIKIGKVLLQNDGGALWTAGTDDLTSTDLTADAGFISDSISYTDLATHVFTPTEITAKRAIFNVNIPSSWVRIYVSTFTGTGEMTAIYSTTEGY